MKKIIYSLTFTLLASCSQLQQADQGLYNVANSVTQRDTITGARKVSTASRAQQIQQGNASILEVINEYKQKGQPVNEQIDAAQFARVKRIFNRIHAASHYANESWTVYMIPDNSFNAFTTGGSSIVVHYGLMKSLSSDDAVAAVIGHEIAHVSAGHISEQKGDAIIASLAGSKSAGTEAYQAGYTINSEKEADQIGILYAALAGYDPYAAAKLWQGMYDTKGLNGQFMSDHPNSKERAAQAQTIAQQVSQYYTPGSVNPDSQNILQNNALYQKRGDMVQAGQGGGLASVLETAYGFYSDHNSAKTTARQQTQQIESLKNIQSNLQVMGQQDVNDSQFGLGVKYNGAQPVESLAIRAVGPAGESLYRSPKVINPGETFGAVFNKNILSADAAQNKSIKLMVDEGYLK